MIFVEAVLAVIAAAVAVQSVAGYAVAGVAALVGVAGLVRRRGRGLVDVLRDRLRDPTPTAVAEPDPTGGPAHDLGLAAALLPDLHVAEEATRGGPGLGVLGDGHGFAALLAVDLDPARSLSLADLARVLTEDPARPAAVQLLVEQAGPGRGGADPDFAPGRTYRTLPVRGLPLWNRVLLVVRHEPTWAPETVAARGGGAIGARRALAAIVGRTVAGAARDGLRLRPLDAAEVTGLVRELGDRAAGGEMLRAATVTATAAHGVLSIPDADTVGAVLQACAELDVERCVVSVAVNAIDHSVCAAVRLVAAEPEALAAAVGELTDTGLADPLPGGQPAGLVATLPLGGGVRSLADLVNQERM